MRVHLCFYLGYQKEPHIFFISLKRLKVSNLFCWHCNTVCMYTFDAVSQSVEYTLYMYVWFHTDCCVIIDLWYNIRNTTLCGKGLYLFPLTVDGVCTIRLLCNISSVFIFIVKFILLWSSNGASQNLLCNFHDTLFWLLFIAAWNKSHTNALKEQTV